MHTIQRIAVAGATGRVGHHLVELLRERGHDVVPMSRATGVDVITGEGLAEALAGVDAIVDAATGPSPEEAAATAFFTTAAANLQREGARAGARKLVVVSIIGADRFPGGYNRSKVAHEEAALAGPLPARILRAAQFHELVGMLMDWGRQGDVTYVPDMRTQLVAARTVAEALADLAADPDAADGPVVEVAGPREERLGAMAELLAARRGDGVQVRAVLDPSDPEHALYEAGALLPSPDATLAGPTFAEWLESA